MARLDPLPPEQWPEGMKAALAALRPESPRHPFPERREGRSKGLNVLGTLAHHPELAKAFHTFNGHILFSTTLSPRQREVLVLRVATVRHSTYEWEQHVPLALDAGLAPEEIARIAQGPEAPGWSASDRALLAAVDELIADGAVSDATWGVLAAELETQQLMDLVFTVGAYEILAMVLKTFGVEPDADLQRK